MYCKLTAVFLRTVHKGLIKKGSSKNTWNKGELQNRYMARWAKGKTGIGSKSLCKFLHPSCAAHYMYMLRDVGICTVYTQSN